MTASSARIAPTISASGIHAETAASSAAIPARKTAAGDRRDEDGQGARAEPDLAPQPALLEFGAGRREDGLRRDGEPPVAAAELELVARRHAGEEAAQQHRPVAVREGRVDELSPQPDAAEPVPLPLDDPDAAHDRLLEHFGRDRLRGQAEQHGALQRVDLRRAACTRR